MKHLSKVVILLLTAALSFVLFGCKNSTNEDDGNSRAKLDAPTNLVINSMTDDTSVCTVNITFKYSGKTGLDGATNAVLGYSTTNDSSKAYYDTNTYANVEDGENTRSVQIPSTSAPYFTPVIWKKILLLVKNNKCCK